MLVISIVFTACKKDDTLTEEKVIDPTVQKILNFKEKMKSGDKSGETMSIDSAVWYIEALANYEYCILTEERENADLNAITVDSMFIDAETSSNKINYNEIAKTYLTVETTIISAFEELDYALKFYDLVDIEFANNEFKVYYAFVYNTNPEKSYPPITEGWYYGQDLGDCDGTSLANCDATDLIYARIETPPIAQFYTDIDNIWKISYDLDFATQNNPYGDYLMYYEYFDTPPFPDAPCIPVDPMNYYVIGTQDAFDITLDLIPQGNSYKSWVLYHFYQEYVNVEKYFGHSIRVYYGIAHTI